MNFAFQAYSVPVQKFPRAQPIPFMGVQEQCTASNFTWNHQQVSQVVV